MLGTVKNPGDFESGPKPTKLPYVNRSILFYWAIKIPMNVRERTESMTHWKSALSCGGLWQGRRLSDGGRRASVPPQKQVQLRTVWMRRVEAGNDCGGWRIVESAGSQTHIGLHESVMIPASFITLNGIHFPQDSSLQLHSSEQLSSCQKYYMISEAHTGIFLNWITR